MLRRFLSTSVITLRGVHVHRGGKPILNNVHVGLLHGAKIGVIGENGAGKSTLLSVLAGRDEVDGEREVASNVCIGVLDQEPHLEDGITVDHAVRQDVAPLLERVALLRSGNVSGAELAALKQEVSAQDGWSLERRIKIACTALRCPPPDACVDVLSGGERRRVALARLLIARPNVLMLDEPTNHLDPHSTFWLEQFLQAYKGTVVAITHDRYFLDAVASWILEVADGQLHPFKGNYSAWLADRADRDERDSRQAKSVAASLKREQEWMNASPGARRKRSAARVNRYEDLVARASRVKHSPGSIVIPPGPRLGRVVVRVEHAKLALGGKTLLDDVSFDLPAGAIIGVVGANGCGKTSLVRCIAGEAELDSGTIEMGETVQLGYAAQSRDDLDEDNTVVDEISGRAEHIDLGDSTVHSRAFAASFGFKGSAALKLVGSLSGGERNRAHLAKVIRGGPNLLVLDEPSNDLSVTVLRSLEAALDDFAGTAIVISHDRFFLDRTSTHTLAFEGNGKVRLFHGPFSEYRKWALESEDSDLTEEAKAVLLGPDAKADKKGGKKNDAKALKRKLRRAKLL